MKKDKEYWELESLKKEYKYAKEDYQKYIEILSEYAIQHMSVCNGGILFDKLYRDELTKGYDKIIETKIPKKRENEFQHKLFPIFHGEWNGPRPTEKEIMKLELKYIEKHNKRAQEILKGLPQKTKEKIVKKGIGKYVLWVEQLHRTFNVYHELLAMEKKRKLNAGKNKTKSNKKKCAK